MSSPPFSQQGEEEYEVVYMPEKEEDDNPKLLDENETWESSTMLSVEFTSEG